jgi:predicted transcriptional regulator of viral defense system
LTEQIFRTIVVMTPRKLRNRKPVLKGTGFLLRTISPNVMFGIRSVWRGQAKVKVPDPTRTVLDMLNNPVLGGGLRPIVDVFNTYMASKVL